MKRSTPAEDETVARDSVDLLRQHRLEQVEKVLDPSISDPNTKEQLNSMAEMFPAEEPKSVKVVGFGILHNQNTSIHNLTLEYEYEQKWPLADVSIKRGNALPTITSFRVTPIANLWTVGSEHFAAIKSHSFSTKKDRKPGLSGVS
jgi:hypothetical protein